MKNRKYILAGVVLCFFITQGFAQAVSDFQNVTEDIETADSQIELPDLTTVITGKDDTEADAPAPDFETVLNINYDSGNLVPVLPAATVGNEVSASTYGDSYKDKDIYAEGRIGGGYPAAFAGDFEISRIYGSNPFKISFNHESQGGFAGHSLTDGYNSKNTSINLQRDFISEKLSFGVAGRYEETGNGLQNKSDSISALTQEEICAFANLNWKLPDNFELISSVDSEFYFRYADVINSSVPVEEWVKSVSRFTVVPQARIQWVYNGFEVGLDGSYSLEAWTKPKNRGQFNLDFSWQNDVVKLYSDVRVVFGNTIGTNQVLVPFTVGVDAVLPVYFSDRKLNLSLKGGMDSVYESTAQIEKKYKFTGLDVIPSETSDWYAQLNLLVPLKTSFTGNIGAGYKSTAFKNGAFIPNFAGVPVNGIYGFVQKDRNELYTDFAFTWKYKLFAATAKYHANWFDIPALENKHTISVNFALQSQKGAWGANFETQYLLDAADNKPLIGFEAYTQLSSATRVVLSVNDALKLLGAQERTYAGQYISNSGNVTLLVKFLF